jgi:hypothetical protein
LTILPGIVIGQAPILLKVSISCQLRPSSISEQPVLNLSIDEIGVGSLNYKFSHDRIQQAAHSLVPNGLARNKLRLLVGNKLCQLGSSDTGED